MTGQSPYVLVRDGEEITLSCGNYQGKCDYINWLFADSINTPSVQLVERGQIGENPKSKSSRLDVTHNCSLVIKEATGEDVGQYTCRELNPQPDHTNVFLSLVTSKY